MWTSWRDKDIENPSVRLIHFLVLLQTGTLSGFYEGVLVRVCVGVSVCISASLTSCCRAMQHLSSLKPVGAQQHKQTHVHPCVDFNSNRLIMLIDE